MSSSRPSPPGTLLKDLTDATKSHIPASDSPRESQDDTEYKPFRPLPHRPANWNQARCGKQSAIQTTKIGNHGKSGNQGASNGQYHDVAAGIDSRQDGPSIAPTDLRPFGGQQASRESENCTLRCTPSPFGGKQALRNSENYTVPGTNYSSAIGAAPSARQYLVDNHAGIGYERFSTSKPDRRKTKVEDERQATHEPAVSERTPGYSLPYPTQHTWSASAHLRLGSVGETIGRVAHGEISRPSRAQEPAADNAGYKGFNTYIDAFIPPSPRFELGQSSQPWPAPLFNPTEYGALNSVPVFHPKSTSAPSAAHGYPSIKGSPRPLSNHTANPSVSKTELSAAWAIFAGQTDEHANTSTFHKPSPATQYHDPHPAEFKAYDELFRPHTDFARNSVQHSPSNAFAHNKRGSEASVRMLDPSSKAKEPEPTPSLSSACPGVAGLSEGPSQDKSTTYKPSSEAKSTRPCPFPELKPLPSSAHTLSHDALRISADVMSEMDMTGDEARFQRNLVEREEVVSLARKNEDDRHDEAFAEDDLYGVSEDEDSLDRGSEDERAIPFLALSTFDGSTETLVEDMRQPEESLSSSTTDYEQHAPTETLVGIMDNISSFTKKKDNECHASPQTPVGGTRQSDGVVRDVVKVLGQNPDSITRHVGGNNAEDPDEKEYVESSEDRESISIPDLVYVSEVQRPNQPSSSINLETRVVSVPSQRVERPIEGKGKRPLTGPKAMNNGPYELSNHATNPYIRPHRRGVYGARCSPPKRLSRETSSPIPICIDCGKPLESLCEHELARYGWVDAKQEMINDGNGPGGESGYEIDTESGQSEGEWDLV